MIVELTIKCLGCSFKAADCSKIVEFDTADNLSTLHDFIITAFEFGWDHMTMFFVGRTANPYSRGNTAIYKDDDGFYDDENSGNYEITLDELYPLPKSCKLFYCYDFGDEWIFQIAKSRKKPHATVAGVTYPRIIKEIGVNPEQY
jgi:Plasmid pRiA4b ORF-3-like protein